MRLGFAELPQDVTWPQFIGAGFLAGIGFTMSLFLANTAFILQTNIDIAKIGILVASIIAALIGVFLLDKYKSDYESVTEIELSTE